MARPKLTLVAETGNTPAGDELTLAAGQAITLREPLDTVIYTPSLSVVAMGQVAIEISDTKVSDPLYLFRKRVPSEPRQPSSLIMVGKELLDGVLEIAQDRYTPRRGSWRSYWVERTPADDPIGVVRLNSWGPRLVGTDTSSRGVEGALQIERDGAITIESRATRGLRVTAALPPGLIPRDPSREQVS